MKDRISDLEHQAATLEVSQLKRDEIFRQSKEYVDQFINSLPTSKAYIKAECPRLATLQVTEEGKPFEELLDVIREEVDFAGINSASGGHMGYIPGGGLWMSSMGDMLAAVANKYAGIIFSGTGAAIMENKLLQWMASLVGYPETAHGNISSGGSIANLAAITTARDDFKIHSGNILSSVIYSTAQVHHSIQKAIHISGLDETRQRIVPMNKQYQMDVEALEAMIKEDVASHQLPFMVIASAGTTNTGAIDPLARIADLCEKYNIWFHVDAAYGGFFMLVDEVKHLFRGIERSDSVILDPHKSLFLPFGTGVVLVRDGSKLISSHQYEASYMIDAMGYDEVSPANCGPELTKHFRGLRMWLPLHYHGLNVFRKSLEEKLYLCRYFQTEISKMGFETGSFPELSIALFRYPAEDANAFNKKLVEYLHADGRIFFSSTVLDGYVWIRCAVLSFRTHLREIQLGLQMIRDNMDRMKSVN